MGSSSKKERSSSEKRLFWNPVGTDGTLTEKIYKAVRERLLEGGVEPETFLREGELAEAFGVSRTPVREALGQLASEGFVERIPQRGFRVPEQSVDDLFHLYPIFSALQVLAGELALRTLDAEELEELSRINHRFEEALRSDDAIKAVEENEHFHSFISERSGNPFLQELLEDLRMQIRRLEVWDFSEVLKNATLATREKWVRQHAEIIAAAREERYEDAASVLRENRTLVYLNARQSQTPGQ